MAVGAVQLHNRDTACHGVVHSRPDGARRRVVVRQLVVGSVCGVALLALAGHWRWGSNAAAAGGNLAQASTEEMCAGCVPMNSAGVAAQAQKVAAAQSQIRVLYDSANGNGGPGFFKTEKGPPLYTFAKGSLTPPALPAPPSAGSGVAAGKWGIATPYTYSVDYHLVWVPDSPGAASGKEKEAAAAGWPRVKASAKDELPFFPVPEKYADGENHAKWVEDDCDDGTKEAGDPECEKKWKWTDHYPHRELVTQTFPYGHYVPQDTYPYIRGPYHHHLEDGKGKQYVDHGGHWVWVSDAKDKIQDHFAPPEDKYQPPPYGQRG